jgi:hypothetical protein
MIPAVIGAVSSISAGLVVGSGNITLLGYDTASAVVYAQRTTNSGASWSSLGTYTSAVNAGLATVGVNSGFKLANGTYGWWNGGGGTSYVETTTNFSTFNVSTSFSAVSTNGGFWNGSAYVIGRTTGIVNSSTDLSTFTQSTAIGGGNNMKGVTYGNGVWVICGQKSTSGAWVWTNTNVNGSGAWSDATGVTSPNTSTVALHVAFGGGKFVAVGSDATYPYSWTSTNGTSWTANGNVTTAVSEQLNSVATDGNGKWVTVGNSGGIYYSTNAGTSWTIAVTGTGAVNYSGVYYTDGVFVATGSNNTVSYSSNGISWTTKNLSVPSTVQWQVAIGST